MSELGTTSERVVMELCAAGLHCAICAGTPISKPFLRRIIQTSSRKTLINASSFTEPSRGKSRL